MLVIKGANHVWFSAGYAHTLNINYIVYNERFAIIHKGINSQIIHPLSLQRIYL